MQKYFVWMEGKILGVFKNSTQIFYLRFNKISTGEKKKTSCHLWTWVECLTLWPWKWTFK